MKAFIGLLKKERMNSFNGSIVILAIALIFIWLLPAMFKNYQPNFNEGESRVAAVLIAILIVSIFSLVSFFGSIKRDLKVKELWLHNSQPMWKLVFAKYLYYFLQLIILAAITTIGFFFCKGSIDGTFIQMLNLNFVVLFIVFVFYIFIAGFAFLFFVFHFQLKRYFGKLSILGTFIVIYLFCKVMDNFPDVTIPYGEIPIDWITSNLPSSTMLNIRVSVGPVYLIEDIVYYLFFALLFLGCCKWLERIVAQ